jgi:ubiquitin carboxyl-terminal hydrolase 4/11/15
MLSDQWLRDKNVTNPLGMKGELATTFARLCEEVWCGSAASVQPSELKRVIGRFAPQFSGFNQQDSHELLTFVLDGIHEDLNRVRKKPSFPEGVYGDGTDDVDRADEAWGRHIARNSSAIVDIFHGQYRSRLICAKCQRVTTVFDPFMSLALPIARQNVIIGKVKFTPYEFGEPIQYFMLTLRAVALSRVSEAQVREALAAELGRDVQIIIQPRISQCGEPDELVVFEVPDHDARYAPCTVKAWHKTGNVGYFLDATHVFLLRLSGLDATAEDAEEECERRIAHIWDEEEVVPPGMKVPQIDHPPAWVPFPPEERLVAMILKSNSLTEKAMKNQVEFADRKVESLLFDNHVAVVLNPDYPFTRTKLCVNWRTTSSASASQAQKKSDKVTLRSCFAFHAEAEVLDEQNQWYCPRCEQFSCAQKKVDIWKVPEVLVLQLKRYVSGQYQTRKLDTPVDFPEVLNLQEFVEGPQKAHNQTYRLFAVSNHMGGMSGGHYTAHAIVQDPRGEPETPPRWYTFNDSSVSPVAPRSWKNAAAYLLFYEKMRSNNDQILDSVGQESTEENDGRPELERG